MPAEAKGTREKSAKAFVRYYIESINFAARTGDTSHLTTLGSSGCVSCEAITGNVEEIYGADGHIETDGWILNRVRTIQADKSSATFSLDVLLQEEVVVKQAGATEEQNAGGKQPMTMFLDRRGTQWLVSKLDLVS